MRTYTASPERAHTARELSAKIGTQVYLEPTPGLRVLCEVTDAKIAYGNARLEIQPLAGQGRAWVNASSVEPAQNQEVS